MVDVIHVQVEVLKQVSAIIEYTFQKAWRPSDSISIDTDVYLKKYLFSDTDVPVELLTRIGEYLPDYFIFEAKNSELKIIINASKTMPELQQAQVLLKMLF